MTILLAEAVKLKSVLRSKIFELTSELQRVSFSTIEKGHPLPHQPRTMQQVEAELSRVRKDLRTIDRLMYQANSSTYLSFQGEELPLVEAIELATQLRAEIELCKEFAAEEPIQHQFSYQDQTVIQRIARFDPERYRLRAIELEKQVHGLSNAINAKNYQIELPFDDSYYFN